MFLLRACTGINTQPYTRQFLPPFRNGPGLKQQAGTIFKASIMSTKVDERQLTVKISYNPANGNFFIDFWEPKKDDPKYIVSVKVSENVAKSISRDTGIEILQ